VSVWARRAAHPEEYVHVTEAKVTYVAVDERLRPIAIARPPAPRI
jgi:acyl-CoA hydrolase